ncbi:hypothetical protein ACJ41O_006610 [Fusarium nematophilum]
MARKGSQKVRTGCLTCKARKVKCDEAKPACNRCTSTGRNCDGYAPQQHDAQRLWATNALSRNPNRAFPGIESQDEGRALQYFCDKAAPYMSGIIDRHFWTNLVMQLASSEPAVRHSVVAISSLYEQLPPSSQRGVAVRVQDHRPILTHYNAAIRELKNMSTPDKQPLVLLVCILFICIEFLQSNEQTAIQHCKHGIVMLANRSHRDDWTREFLEPIFRRLTLFPYFFGKSEADYPPNLCALGSSSLPLQFSSFADARYVMDELFTRSLRLMRLGDECRVGRLMNKPVPDDMVKERMVLNSLLDSWDSLFATLLASLSTLGASTAEEPNILSQHFLSIRSDVCRIMANNALEKNEMGYDRFLGTFRRISARLTGLANANAIDTRSPKFTFEMGFMPVLGFSVFKCRHLETRLQIWRSMPALGFPRESLWQLKLMISLTRRVVEMEHGAELDELMQRAASFTTELPSDRRRIRLIWADSKPTSRLVRGQVALGRIVGFYRPYKDGKNDIFTEFLTDTEYI